MKTINYKKISTELKKNDNDKMNDYVLLPTKVLKEISKETTEKIPKNGDFFDITLKNLSLSLATNYKNIINEIIDLFSNKNIIIADEHFGSVNKFKTLISGLIIIFTKENRLIYTGILLLFISFLLYFIDISSK